MKNVANHCPGRRGNDADDARQIGQRLLAFSVEQPFGAKPRLQLFEQQHQRAFARDLQAFDDQLIFGAAGIGGELARRDHLDAIFGPEGEARRLPLPHHHVDQRVVVLERGVEMP